MNEFFNEYRDRLQDWISGLHFSPLHKRALIAIAVLVCVVSVGVVARGHSDPIVESAPIVIAPPHVIVDVAGGVKSPGVYSLPANSRVMDALKAAGGARPGTDVSDINLARIIKDGEQIYVDPSVASVTRSGGPLPAGPISRGAPLRVAKKKSGPININRATADEFDTLPGIGPVLAARIVNYRKVNGPFATIDDLQKVSGIGSVKFADLKSKVRV